jgi:hypothetical protein
MLVQQLHSQKIPIAIATQIARSGSVASMAIKADDS